MFSNWKKKEINFAFYFCFRIFHVIDHGCLIPLPRLDFGRHDGSMSLRLHGWKRTGVVKRTRRGTATRLAWLHEHVSQRSFKRGQGKVSWFLSESLKTFCFYLNLGRYILKNTRLPLGIFVLISRYPSIDGASSLWQTFPQLDRDLFQIIALQI